MLRTVNIHVISITYFMIQNDDDSEDERSTNAEDPWAGLSYTIDLETGELLYILLYLS